MQDDRRTRQWPQDGIDRGDVSHGRWECTQCTWAHCREQPCCSGSRRLLLFGKLKSISFLESEPSTIIFKHQLSFLFWSHSFGITPKWRDSRQSAEIHPGVSRNQITGLSKRWLRGTCLSSQIPWIRMLSIHSLGKSTTITYYHALPGYVAMLRKDDSPRISCINNH